MAVTTNVAERNLLAERLRMFLLPYDVVFQWEQHPDDLSMRVCCGWVEDGKPHECEVVLPYGTFTDEALRLVLVTLRLNGCLSISQPSA